jgi:hypothetical protein
MIKNIETIFQVAKDWKPSDLAFIKKLEWSDGDVKILFLCQGRKDINGWPDLSKEFFEVSIFFKQVSDFKLEIKGSKLHQLSGFDIVDISNNGWESAKFQIEDYEDGSITFYCKDIVVDQVSSPDIMEFE